MKNLLTSLLLLLVFAAGAVAQNMSSGPPYRGARTADPATCTPRGQWYFNTSEDVFKYCVATNTWSGLLGASSASNFQRNYTTPVTAFGTPWLGYGRDTTFSTATDIQGMELYLPITLTDAAGSQNIIGTSSRLNLEGGSASGSLIANLAYIFTNGLNAPGSTMYGNFTSVDIGGPLNQVYGGYFQSAIGSVGAGTSTSLAVGVYGSASASYNQARVATAIGGDFRVSSSPSAGGVVVPSAMGVRIRANMSTDTTFTDLRGISLSGWTTSSGGTATTSYGLYADTSIDIGATRYFIYSLSTSPSRFAGDVVIRDSTKGIILTSPDGTCYRFTVANGGALSAGAAVTCP